MSKDRGATSRVPGSAEAPGRRTDEARQRVALVVKVVHSALVFIMAAAAITILVDGLTGRRDVWLVLSLTLVGVEAVIYAVNGLRCPLTKLARHLGDDTGHDWLFERLLPEAYVFRVAPFFAWVTLLGLLAMGFRWLLRVPV